MPSGEPPNLGDFPSPADLIDAHAAALDLAPRTARFHVLHRGALEAVAARPRHHAHYRGAEVAEQAAVLAEGLCREHCFVDGNKRTAWVALQAFLEVRTGRSIEAEAAEAAEWMVHLTIGDRDASDLAVWITSRLR